MTGRIVCAIDSTDNASRVLRHAAALAADLRLDLALVHVAADGPHPNGHRAAVERGRYLAWQEAQDMFGRLRAEHGLAGDAPGEVVFGTAGQSLEQISQEPDTAMIVVGSRGRGPLRSAVLGSTSARLASASACPVVIVSPEAADSVPATGHGVVCAVGDNQVDLPEIAYAEDLAERLGEPLRVMRVDCSTNVPSPARAIEEVANNDRARLIVIGATSRGPRFGTLLSGSLASQLGSYSGRPVVVVPTEYELDRPGRHSPSAVGATA